MSVHLFDLRLALRSLRRSPNFTLIAVLTLALGIGANTAIFSLLDGVLLKPLPLREPHRIVNVAEAVPDASRDTLVVSVPLFRDWRDRNEVFERMSAVWGRSFVLTDTAEPVQISATGVSPHFFDLLGVPPQLGRDFGEEDLDPGQSRVVILSHELWRGRYGGDPSVVGSDIRLDGEPYGVIGVAAPEVAAFGKSQLWVPAAFGQPLANSRDTSFLPVIARIRQGLSLEEAQRGMEVLAAQIATERPEIQGDKTVKLLPLLDLQTRRYRSSLLLLMGAVSLVLLIACANIAGLMLVRVSARRRELAVRAALGAGRGRLVKQLLTECLLLAAAGGLLGLAVATAALELIRALGTQVPRISALTLDARVLAFCWLASMAAGLFFGLVPALRATARGAGGLQSRLRSRDGDGGHQRLRSGFIVAQIALATVLMAGAGLMVRSLGLLMAQDPGFQSERILNAHIRLPSYTYPEPEQQRAFFGELLARLQAIPEFEAVGASNALPFSLYQWMSRFELLDSSAESGAEMTNTRVVTPDYFRALGIPLMQGRPFAESDRAGAPPVVIVNTAFARRHLGDGETLGRRMTLRGVERPVTVVGVVGEVRHLGLDEEPKPELYQPLGQAAFPIMMVTVRTREGADWAETVIRDQVRSVDANQPIERVATMDRWISDSMSLERFYASVLGAFAALAILLAAVGIYGLVSYTVTRRTREIGIRMALGARSRDAVGLFVRQGVLLTVLGLTLGLAASLAATRLLSHLLFGVTPTDPLTLVSIGLLLAAVAIGAAFVPARRASRVDPLVALRTD